MHKILQEHGQGVESVAASLLETTNKVTDDPVYKEDVMQSTLASMYAGGADTVRIFLFVMTHS